jgi:MSHA biogenesis protein MshP
VSVGSCPATLGTGFYKKIMRTESGNHYRGGRQRGVSLVAAIFVLVVLAALGGYIASISVFQHAGSTLSMQQVRASAAAAAGVDWGIYYVRSNDSCAGATNFTIGQFTVTQDSCTLYAVTEGASSYNVFDLRYSASTTGSSFGSSDFASSSHRAMVVGP